MFTANYEVYIGFTNKTWDSVAVDITYNDDEDEAILHRRAEQKAVELHNKSFEIVFAAVSHCNYTSNANNEN